MRATCPPEVAFSGETMSRLIGSNGEDYRIVAAHDRHADEPAVEFLDERDAFSFLRRMAEDEFNRAAIRRLAAEDGLVVDAYAVGDQRLLEYLAMDLISGRLRAVRPGEWQRASTLGSRRPGEAAEPKQAEEEEAPPPSDEKTWIKFEIIDDETGKPVSGVTLKIKLPDGQSRHGKSDASGIIEFKDIDPGTCEIERMLDGETLEVVSVE